MLLTPSRRIGSQRLLGAWLLLLDNRVDLELTHLLLMKQELITDVRHGRRRAAMIVDDARQVELLVCSLTGRRLSAWRAGNVEGLDALLEARADTATHLVRFLEVLGLRRCVLVMHMVSVPSAAHILRSYLILDRLLLTRIQVGVPCIVWHDLLVVRRGRGPQRGMILELERRLLLILPHSMRHNRRSGRHVVILDRACGGLKLAHYRRLLVLRRLIVRIVLLQLVGRSECQRCRRLLHRLLLVGGAVVRSPSNNHIWRHCDRAPIICLLLGGLVLLYLIQILLRVVVKLLLLFNLLLHHDLVGSRRRLVLRRRHEVVVGEEQGRATGISGRLLLRIILLLLFVCLLLL